MNYKLSDELSVTVVRAETPAKLRLLTYLSDEMDETTLALTKSEIMEPENEMFLIFQSDQTDPLAYCITTDYVRMNKSKEIIFYSPEAIEDIDLYSEILQQLISFLSESNGTDYIILKIRDSLKTLACAAERIGFMKDGIFISNQFLEGEFTFYSVYRYKLI